MNIRRIMPLVHCIDTAIDIEMTNKKSTKTKAIWRHDFNLDYNIQHKYGVGIDVAHVSSKL